MKAVYLLLSLALLSACGTTQTVLMKNPRTGDVKECKRDPWKNWEWQEKEVINNCKTAYEKAGYVEVK